MSTLPAQFDLTPAPLPESLWLEAAGRLVATDPRETQRAARQLVDNASAHGIDFAMAVASRLEGRLRQVCLPVLGAGRTAMFFVSRPGQGAAMGQPDAQQAERTAVVREALDRLRRDPRAALAQGLSLPSERFAIEAYEAAGMARIAELRYLSRPLAKRKGPLPKPGETIAPPSGDAWPGGASVQAYAANRASPDADGALAEAILASYRETLDCPDLRSMRRIEDVVASHRETGDWTPGLWWIVRLDGVAAGCLLLNPCPLEDSAELTYLGVSPEARGCGLASALLSRGIEFVERLGLGSLRCAVDVQNAPAMRLYERAGFVPIGSRVAHACSVETVKKP